MNKRLVRITLGLTFLAAMTLIFILVYDNHLNKEENMRLPNRISSYWNTGYYKIDPETILASLERGDTNVFTPLLDDPQVAEEVTDIPIGWTQEDFLKIASALGRFEWNDPMDLNDWSLYFVYFEGSCDDPIGFNFANITYFKMGKKRYATRVIEIDPYFGKTGWGDGETYPKPILRKWNGVDLLGAKISADDALRIASEDAKKRFKFENNCGVLMISPESNDYDNWHLKFFGAPDLIAYVVNLDTGDYTFQTLNK